MLVLSEVCDSIVLALYIVSLLMSQRTVVPAVFGAADILSALDEVVFPEESVKMVRAINKNGGNAKITMFEKADHNAWDPAFSLDEMWEWMLSQKRG